MAEYKEVVDTVEVPKSTGVEGFIRLLREILHLPRVQAITIEANGKVSYRHFVLNGETRPIGIDFKGLEPYAVIRNAPIEELQVHIGNAAIIVTSVLDQAVREKLHPIAFVTGANSVLWKWYASTTGFSLQSQTHLCGLPIHKDRHAPDTALILCAAYSRGAELVDTQRSFKVEMSFVPQHVEVM